MVQLCLNEIGIENFEIEEFNLDALEFLKDIDEEKNNMRRIKKFVAAIIISSDSLPEEKRKYASEIAGRIKLETSLKMVDICKEVNKNFFQRVPQKAGTSTNSPHSNTPSPPPAIIPLNTQGASNILKEKN